jgi:hypothetical protein
VAPNGRAVAILKNGSLAQQRKFGRTELSINTIILRRIAYLELAKAEIASFRVTNPHRRSGSWSKNRINIGQEFVRENIRNRRPTRTKDRKTECGARYCCPRAGVAGPALFAILLAGQFLRTISTG